GAVKWGRLAAPTRHCGTLVTSPVGIGRCTRARFTATEAVRVAGWRQHRLTTYRERLSWSRVSAPSRRTTVGAHVETCYAEGRARARVGPLFPPVAERVASG